MDDGGLMPPRPSDDMAVEGMRVEERREVKGMVGSLNRKATRKGPSPGRRVIIVQMFCFCKVGIDEQTLRAPNKTSERTSSK
jgi:hypothetical protein